MINMNNEQNLKIIAINVNSIISYARRASLVSFLEEHNPDIVLLNETKLNSKHKLCFENYNLVRKDRLNSLQGPPPLVVRPYSYKKISKI